MLSTIFATQCTDNYNLAAFSNVKLGPRPRGLRQFLTGHCHSIKNLIIFITWLISVRITVTDTAKLVFIQSFNLGKLVLLLNRLTAECRSELFYVAMWSFNIYYKNKSINQCTRRFWQVSLFKSCFYSKSSTYSSETCTSMQLFPRLFTSCKFHRDTLNFYCKSVISKETSQNHTESWLICFYSKCWTIT